MRIERDQPIRSPITVAGIIGNAFNNSRIRGSNTSTDEPTSVRSYFGGPSDASADRTVFLEIPSTRAICEIDILSARCNRRISAQSSTLSTYFLPGSDRSDPARVSAQVLNLQMPRPVQFSVAVDTHDVLRTSRSLRGPVLLTRQPSHYAGDLDPSAFR